MSRAPFVAMRTDLRKEERVRFTADFCGYNEDEAIGKYFRLWSWCLDRGLEDAPDDGPGYAVPDAIVRRFLGPRGVDGILGDGCDELAMGARRPDGLIYLRGTEDTVSRLRTARAGTATGASSVSYAIEAMGCYVVKVGRTTDVDRRVAELQTSHHSTLEVIGVVAGDVEQAIHRELDALGKRRRGEWFDMDASTELVLAHHGIGRSC